MIDEPDFSIEGENQAAVEQPAVTPPPRVVIEYRERGFSSLLVPPLLILLAALGILASRRATPILVPPRQPPPVATTLVVDPKPEGASALEPLRRDRAPAEDPGESTASAPTPSPKAPARAPTLPELPDLDEMLPPLAANSIHAPAPADRPGTNQPSPETANKAETPAAAKAETAPASDPERTRKPVPIGLPLDPPAVVAAQPQEPSAVVADPPPGPEAAEPVPEVTKEQVLAEIRDEAARRAAEIRKIEGLKPQVRFLEVGRVIRKAEASRAPFHKALKELLKSRRPSAGQEIEALCNEYGRTTLPEIRAHIGKIISTTYARSTLKVKVEMMRSWGYPEAMIFDYVANSVDRRLGTPGGPRDGDEVRVRAARLLLAMPPATTATQSVAGSPPVPSSTNGQRPH